MTGHSNVLVARILAQLLGPLDNTARDRLDCARLPPCLDLRHEGRRPRLRHRQHDDGQFGEQPQRPGR